MRDASIAVLREIGVDTGGSNVQFAHQPGGRPHGRDRDEPARVALLGAGLEGHRLPDRQGRGQARGRLHAGRAARTRSPAARRRRRSSRRIDYVVTKVPRFAFEKFPQANDRLTTQMKSVGEVMAIGRTFQESFQKALRGLEVGVDGLNQTHARPRDAGEGAGRARARSASGTSAMRSRTASRWKRCTALTHDRSLVPRQIEEIVELEMELDDQKLDEHRRGRRCAQLKRKGFSDRRLAYLFKTNENEVREKRHALGIRPVYKRVDTCAAEFATQHRLHVLDLRGGVRGRADRRARRSWCSAAGRTASARASSSTTAACTRRSRCARTASRPSWSTATRRPSRPTTTPRDRLYFEPLTLEDVLEIVDKEKPVGRDRAVRRPDAAQARARPRGRRRADHRHQRRHRSTSPRTASASRSCCTKLKLRQPPNRTARIGAGGGEARRGDRLPGGGAPELRARRPRDGDRAPAAPTSSATCSEAVKVSNDSPVLLDRFLTDAIEVDVDCVSRRQARADRRHHGAHRAGGRALGRLGLLPAAALAREPTSSASCAARPR